MSAREKLVNGGDFIKVEIDEDEDSIARAIKKYDDVIRKEVMISNKVLLTVRKYRLRRLLTEEMGSYIEELALEDKAMYKNRL